MSLTMDSDIFLGDHKVQTLLPEMARVEYGQYPHYDKYVSRTMRCLPDKFIELCHMHLAFLLDLSGDKLELLLSGHEEHQKRKFGLPSVGMFKKKDKPHGLFGAPLTDDGVCLMLPLIKFLKTEKNVAKEGLFRKPGNKSRITTLKELLIARGSMVSIDPEIFSPNDVACVLKEFVRELPEPLLTERHLEAHRQILALGQHARTPEEIARYSSRKLSALQLLMLLLPSPAQKLTMHLVQLLQRIADSPESKMTSATLGTIFAPIFFIERKVQPRDLYCQITTTSPAVSFMIDKAHELFQPPKELILDLTKFWCSMGQAPLHSQNKEPGQMQKSLSGRTLYTNVCYADRELSKCDDVASNTQAELANLLAHVETLPITPHSAKLKKQIMKTIDTPEFCGGLRRRSKSIGASIKKRLPSLGRLMNKQGDMPESSASSSSSSDSKTETSARTRLFECPAHTFEARRSLRVPRPGHKRHYASENCPTTVPFTSSNTPVKQKCKEATAKRTTVTVTVEQKPPNGAGCKILLNSNRNSTNVVVDFDENSCPSGLASNLEDPAAYDIENTDPISQISVRIIGKTDPVSNTLQQQLGPVHTGASVSLAKSEASSVHLNKAGCFQSETRIDYLPHVAIKQITLSVTSSRNSSPVINTRQQPSRKPGTPVMTRAALRVIQGNILESSF